MGAGSVNCRGREIDHRWKAIAHVDGCHFYATTFACVDCPATMHVSNERDIGFDPYSAIWMEDDGGPEDEPCERCRELMAGAKPRESEVALEVGV
jgi:hypothetical protein